MIFTCDHVLLYNLCYLINHILVYVINVRFCSTLTLMLKRDMAFIGDLVTVVSMYDLSSLL